MKARKRGSNDEWQNIAYVQLENSDILYKERYLEFDTLSTELKTNSQISNEKHWQEVRERAAIAALSGLLSFPNTVGSCKQFAETSIDYANALIEELKKK